MLTLHDAVKFYTWHKDENIGHRMLYVWLLELLEWRESNGVLEQKNEDDKREQESFKK